MNVFARRLRSHQPLLLALGLYVADLSQPGMIWAQPSSLADSLTGDARADYEAAKVLYVDGDFAGAYLKFAQAYKKSNDARLLWNMAAARKGERRYAEVERLVKQYLREATQLSDVDRADANSLLQTIDAFIVDVSITVNQAGSSVVVDGRQVGVAPLTDPVRVDIGKHEFRISKAGYETFTGSQEVTEDTTLAVNLLRHEAEGTLRLVTPAGTESYVDGKRVTSGEWTGALSAGTHEVEVRTPGGEPFRTRASIQDGESTTLHVTQQDLGARPVTPPPPKEDSGGGSGWLWLTAGVLVLGGAAAGGYFLLKPEPNQTAPQQGTIGTVELPLRF